MKFFLARRTIFSIWLAWALIMVGYQFYVRARFEPKPPDYATFWTPGSTQADSQNGKPYLLEPFLNQHVSWDSEYYLSIAVGGYEDPVMRAIPPYYSWENAQIVSTNKLRPNWISENHAFFPFYPYTMRVVMVPLRIFGLNDIATATLAGVLVSMLGTLGAMLALYDLARDDLGEAGGIRAAFYLLIWPAGMFLAEVYTEGLFLGLSFGALAFARRRNWIAAAILTACATWTRAAGGLLLLPMAWYWWRSGGLDRLWRNRLWRDRAWIEIGKLLLIASPVFAYLIWNATLGHSFHIIETRWYSRGLLLIDQSWHGWKQAWEFMWNSQGRTYSQVLQGRAYYLVEFGAIGFGLISCVLMLRLNPALSLYSLATIIFSATSGSAQGMHRYVMAAPVIFLVSARWGKHEAFDRAWTLAGVLLMGVFAIMFSYDFWAG
jgi:Gpi18-like mannosyltransferase